MSRTARTGRRAPRRRAQLSAEALVVIAAYVALIAFIVGYESRAQADASRDRADALLRMEAAALSRALREDLPPEGCRAFVVPCASTATASLVSIGGESYVVVESPGTGARGSAPLGEGVGAALSSSSTVDLGGGGCEGGLQRVTVCGT